jgi:DNA-binding CsgD family transcriptional regulator/tetratricopeptide (TPR) repeat protein
VDKSLLRPELARGQEQESPDGEMRFGLLETIREYATELLETMDEADSVRWAHAEYYMSLVKEAERNRMGPNVAVWAERLDWEQDNLLSAVRWLQNQGDNGLTLSLELGGMLGWIWAERGHWNLGRSMITSLLDRAEPASAVELAKVREAITMSADAPHAAEVTWDEDTFARLSALAMAFNTAGNLAWRQMDHETAKEQMERSEEIYRQIGDKVGLARVLAGLSSLARREGNYVAARAYTEEKLALSYEIGDKVSVGTSLLQLGTLDYAEDDKAKAEAMHEEGLVIFREIGYQGGMASALLFLGEMARERSDYARARTLYEEALQGFRQQKGQMGIAISLHNLGHTVRHQGGYAYAASLFEEGLSMYQEMDTGYGLATCLSGLAATVVSSDPTGPTLEVAARAAKMLSAARSLINTAGEPLDPADQAEFEAAVERARSTLGDEAFERAWAQGEMMTTEAILSLARETITLSGLGREPATETADAETPPVTVQSLGLSAREMEVLRLVAEGLSDAEVASRLFLSRHTINAHLRSIYAKMNVNSRQAATRFALEHNLI